MIHPILREYLSFAPGLGDASSLAGFAAPWSQGLDDDYHLPYTLQRLASLVDAHMLERKAAAAANYIRFLLANSMYLYNSDSIEAAGLLQ